MMIHDKLVSGQFLLDLKNERSGLLQAAAVAQHHQPQALHHLQSPSPPMAALDIYSAYAYQQQLQQQFLNSAVPQHLPNTAAVAAAASLSPQPAEVLDLSRRDSVDLPRNTPSPYQTNSSFCTSSPAASPSELLKAQQQPTAPLIPANLLYAAQAQQQAQSKSKINIPPNLAALYHPAFYYSSGAVKPEPMSTTTTPPPPLPPPPTVSMDTNTSAAKSNNNLLQTIASAAAVAAVTSLQHDTPEPNTAQQSEQQATPPTIAAAATATATTLNSSTTSIAALDSKNTRPFKAFPRDPLVIAANFAATDVLLDNPRVERYTEYRKRVLEQIRSSNGGYHTITNPKMRRTNSPKSNIHEGSSSNTSENDERHHEESSDCESNTGNDNQSTATNPEISSSSSTPGANTTTTTSSGSGIVKDAAYYERRRKNNAAAKKSRDRRRIKEDEIAIRAAYLERQNIELICQIDALKAQLAALTSKM